jgi:hypothetical protein
MSGWGRPTCRFVLSIGASGWPSSTITPRTQSSLDHLLRLNVSEKELSPYRDRVDRRGELEADGVGLDAPAHRVPFRHRAFIPSMST